VARKLVKQKTIVFIRGLSPFSCVFRVGASFIPKDIGKRVSGMILTFGLSPFSCVFRVGASFIPKDIGKRVSGMILTFDDTPHMS
jgi:hypothetical protein